MPNPGEGPPSRRPRPPGPGGRGSGRRPRGNQPRPVRRTSDSGRRPPGRRPPPPPPGRRRGGPRGRKIFSLVRVGAPPINLTEGGAFTVGRSADCSLTVPSQRVSRQHAEITWANGRPILKDMGSQNGTLINGKRIKGEHALKDGDEIEFGPFMCTYRCGPGAEHVGSGLMPDSNALTQPMVGDAMAGRLDQINLVELLQTLSFNSKTGTLEIFGSDGEGCIVIQSGTPVFARAEGRKGEEAVYELVGYKNGQFSFSAEITETERNVNQNMNNLLMEAVRRIDEG